VGTRFSATVQTDLGAHAASHTMGTGSFPGVKCGRGVLLTTHPLLVPRSWKSRAISLPNFWATGPHRACNGITLPFKRRILVPTFQVNLSIPKDQAFSADCLTLKIGLTYCAETSINNYYHMLCNMSKQRRAQLR